MQVLYFNQAEILLDCIYLIGLIMYARKVDALARESKDLFEDDTD